MNWIIIINALAVDPFWGDIEKLVDQENNWRRRVGNYRIFCEIFQEKKLVYIVDIKRRASNTY